MNYSLIMNQIKVGLRLTLLLAIVILNFGPAGTNPAHAAPPNDNFANATIVPTTLPFTETLDTTTAADAGDGPAVPGSCDNKQLRKGLKNVWYKYTPEASKQVYFDSIGSTPAPGADDYDTYIAAWKGPNINNLTLVGCDDDTDLFFQSQLLVSVTAGVTYYIEVAQYNGYLPGGPTYTPTGGTLKFNVSNISLTDVTIGGNLQGSYAIPKKDAKLATYAGLNGGPVQVLNTFNLPVVSSLRLLYKNVQGQYTYSELMGVPTNQLSNDYWLPYYKTNSTDTDTQIRFTNTSTSLSTTVKIYLGNNPTEVYSKPLGPSSSDRVNLTLGTAGGPVHIVGDNVNAKILAGMRVIYGGGISFDELMAYPTAGLSSEYWFPFYNHNNVNLASELRIANTSSTDTATVDIYFGSTKMNPTSISIPPLSAVLQSYPGQNGGPVRVVSTNVTPVKLVTSLRLLYKNGLGTFTYSELMGVPTSQLSTDYWLPYYKTNTTDTDTQIRFTNTSTTTGTTVAIFLGNNSTPVYSVTLGPSSADRKTLPAGTIGGPVRIVGNNPNAKILAGMRVVYGGVAGNMSFDELMAYPTAGLSPEYWFPFYNHNNVNLDTEVRIGLP